MKNLFQQDFVETVGKVMQELRNEQPSQSGKGKISNSREAMGLESRRLKRDELFDRQDA
jgi:hypothetical protein